MCQCCLDTEEATDRAIPSTNVPLFPSVGGFLELQQYIYSTPYPVYLFRAQSSRFLFYDAPLKSFHLKVNRIGARKIRKILIIVGQSQALTL